MDSRRLGMIRRVVGEMRDGRPGLFAAVDALAGHPCPADACRALGDIPAGFRGRYDAAMAFVTGRLSALGYAMPGSEADERFEERMEWPADGGRVYATPALPSREVVALWYGGHIFHEALNLCQRGDWAGVSGLWTRFPKRRLEVEVAFALAQEGKALGTGCGAIEGGARLGDALGGTAVASCGAGGGAGFSLTVIADRVMQAASRHALPGLAGLAAVLVVLTIAQRPPVLRHATQVIPTLLEEGMASMRGIFDFSSEALKKPDAPGREEKAAAPAVVRAPRPEPPPEVALPKRRMASLAMLPESPRAIEMPRAAIRMPDMPDIAVPQREAARPASGYFGDRPEVRIAPPQPLPRRAGMAGLPGSVPRPMPQQASQPGPEKVDLKGYRAAGRIGFSSFQASRSLAGELVRLTRIERYLSELRAGRSLTFEGTKVVLSRARAQMSFANGVAFVITFTLGRLDDIQIFLKSGVERRLNTQEEAVRGIRTLARAIEGGGGR